MPIIISQNLSLSEPIGSQPLNHSRIGYQTFTRGVTPTVSTTAAGFYAGALSNSLTAERWKPTASAATVKYDFGSDRFIDYVGIAAHTFKDNPCTVLVEGSLDDVTYGELANFLANDSRAIMALFTKSKLRYLRFTLTYAGGDPAIGVIYAGIALAMQRGLYGGHSPITLSRNTETYPQTSSSGQWLGRSIINNGFKSSAAWKNLKADWYRQYFDPFVISARRYPFFFAWNPLQFEYEVALCWDNSNIQPSNMGIRDLMDVSIDLNGHGADI